MVRVYANMLGLSKTLARAGLCGHEARSLAPFTSAFNRAQDLFDFVDAAEKKEGSDFKIRGAFLRIAKPVDIRLKLQQVLIAVSYFRNVPSFRRFQSVPTYLLCGLP
jgi:hypothetical protein